MGLQEARLQEGPFDTKARHGLEVVTGREIMERRLSAQDSPLKLFLPQTGGADQADSDTRAHTLALLISNKGGYSAQGMRLRRLGQLTHLPDSDESSTPPWPRATLASPSGFRSKLPRRSIGTIRSRAESLCHDRNALRSASRQNSVTLTSGFGHGVRSLNPPGPCLADVLLVSASTGAQRLFRGRAAWAN